MCAALFRRDSNPDQLNCRSGLICEPFFADQANLRAAHLQIRLQFCQKGNIPNNQNLVLRPAWAHPFLRFRSACSLPGDQGGFLRPLNDWGRRKEKKTIATSLRLARVSRVCTHVETLWPSAVFMSRCALPSALPFPHQQHRHISCTTCRTSSHRACTWSPKTPTLFCVR